MNRYLSQKTDEDIEDILMLFARCACEDQEVIVKILERALERGIFDKGLYDTYGIITSAEVQQEYLALHFNLTVNDCSCYTWHKEKCNI